MVFEECGGNYPIMAKIARDVLAIPATTVDMEREFSIAADLATSKRSSMSAEQIRQLMCLKSWIEGGLFNIVDYWEKRAVRK